MKYNFYDYEFELEDDGGLLIKNNSGKSSQIWFLKPSILYAPYSDSNFNSGCWCRVHPNNLIDANDFFKLIIEIRQIDKVYILNLDLQSGEITDVTNPIIKVNNFEIEPIKLSVIISSFETKAYILECLKSLWKQSSKYYQLEIILGIDNCYQTLSYIHQLVLPDCVKVYFFEENVGKFAVVNTLVTKSSGDYLLFFDSDDIAIPGIFDATRYLIEHDLLILKCLRFEDGSNYLESNDLTSIGGCMMISKKLFLSFNGYQRWRCSGDDEFIRRCRHNGIKIFGPEDPYYYYRTRSQSLSRSQLYNTNSEFRQVYLNILTMNQSRQSWPNPKKLFTDRCIRIF